MSSMDQNSRAKKGPLCNGVEYWPIVGKLMHNPLKLSDKYYHIVNWGFRGKLRWNLKLSSKICIEINAFENVVSEMSASL